VNAHGVEVEFGERCGGVTWLKKDFRLKQYQFHSPSEHTITGGHFPMEVHHVHVADDGQALVIAVMVTVGNPGNNDSKSAFLRDILADMPDPTKNLSTNYHQVTKEYTQGNPYTNFIPSLASEFYYYIGSLTTPPCTTNTTWLFAKDIVVVPNVVIYTHRDLINSIADDKLGTFEEITRLDPIQWHIDVKVDAMSWSPAMKGNNRPYQSLSLGSRNLQKVLPASTETAVTTAGRFTVGLSPRVASSSSAWLAMVLAAALAQA
jgi:hypothetical protein